MVTKIKAETGCFWVLQLLKKLSHAGLAGKPCDNKNTNDTDDCGADSASLLTLSEWLFNLMLPPQVIESILFCVSVVAGSHGGMYNWECMRVKGQAVTLLVGTSSGGRLSMLKPGRALNFRAKRNPER